MEALAASPLLNAIRRRDVDLVVNLPNSRSTQLAGNFLIRRTAVDHAVPLLTNVRLVALLADSLEKHSRTPMVALLPRKLEELYRAESPAQAWTDPKEFH